MPSWAASPINGALYGALCGALCGSLKSAGTPRGSEKAAELNLGPARLYVVMLHCLLFRAATVAARALRAAASAAGPVPKVVPFCLPTGGCTGPGSLVEIATRRVLPSATGHGL